MTPADIKILLQKYNSGKYTAEEEAQIEWCLENDLVSLEQLEDIQQLDLQLDKLVQEDLSKSMRSAFQQAMEMEQQLKRETIVEKIQRLFNFSPSFGWGMAMAVFLIGLFAGRLLLPTGSQAEMANLSNQVLEMKEMMMLSMLEKESTSERLKAVTMVSDIPSASNQVTTALIQTMNTDDNINVRMAALDALYLYADDPNVRLQLIQSIELQTSPLMQIALAEVMVALQEKRSVDAFKKLFDQSNVPGNIKINIEEKLRVLL